MESTLAKVGSEVQESFVSTVKASKRKNTRSTYAKAQKQYAEFCNASNLDESETSSIYTFLVHLKHEGKATSTIKTYASALGASKLELVSEFLKGLANEASEKGNRTKQAAAIRKADLKQHLPTGDDVQVLRDRALILLGWYGAFRRSELVGLTFADVKGCESGLTIEVHGAKNDKQHKGQVKAIPMLAKHAAALCPVRAMKAYIAAAFPNGYEKEAKVFVSIRKGGKVQSTGLTGRSACRIVQKYFGAEYSAHSLRSGFITEASSKGASAQNIARQTGHKTLDMINQYSRFSNIWESNPVTEI